MTRGELYKACLGELEMIKESSFVMSELSDTLQTSYVTRKFLDSQIKLSVMRINDFINQLL